MPKLGNGFVFEVRDVEDYPSFAAFQEEMRQGRVMDQLYGRVTAAWAALARGSRRCLASRALLCCRLSVVQLPLFRP